MIIKSNSSGTISVYRNVTKERIKTINRYNLKKTIKKELIHGEVLNVLEELSRK